MPKNSLYAVVNKVFSQEKTPLSMAEVSHRTYKEGGHYFLFELAVPMGRITEHYTLVSNHLSVPEEPQGVLDFKGQVHYTAVLVNTTTKEEHRLHVYFNFNDQAIGSPRLSLITAEGFTTVDYPEGNQAFKLLATISTDRLMAHLRAKQQELVTALQVHYEKLEKLAVALSTELDSNKKTYLDVISRQLALLEQLNLYENPNPKTFGLISYLTKVKKVLEQQSPLPSSALDPVKPKASENKKRSGRHRHKPLPRLPEAPLLSEGLVPIKKKTGLTSTISALKKELKKIKQLAGAQLTSSLTPFLNQLVAIELEIETDVYEHVSVANLQALRLLRMAIEQLAKETIEYLLREERYDDVAQLASFYYLLLEEHMISNALSANNPQLINFLLENNILSGTCGSFTIKGKPYPSIVDFYFQQTPMDGPTKRCFGLFISHGLSLMEIDRHTGLPFAAVILLDPAHPLRSVLEAQAGFTIRNKMFYRELNQLLVMLASQPSCLPAKKEQIEQLIAHNRVQIKLLGPMISRSVLSTTRQTAQDLLHDAEVMCGETLINKLRRDPQIIDLNKKNDAWIARLMKQLPLAECRAIKAANQEELEKIRKQFETMKTRSLVPPSYEELKDAAVQRLSTISRMLALRVELAELQRQLKSCERNGRRLTKTQKDLFARQNEIQVKLREYNQQAAVKSPGSGSEREKIEAALAQREGIPLFSKHPIFQKAKEAKEAKSASQSSGVPSAQPLVKTMFSPSLGSKKPVTSDFATSELSLS